MVGLVQAELSYEYDVICKAFIAHRVNIITDTRY